MNETAKLKNLLLKKANLVAMIAPSFPIMYDAKDIVAKLKTAGFKKVVEVAVGAKETNRQLIDFINKNPNERVITSPCASFVRYMKTKHPQYLPFLKMNIDSPMVATAKIVKEKFPGFQPVFIGPCLVKKLEASQDHPELNILVLTYHELETVFKELNISLTTTGPATDFDLVEPSTRMYPTDGGLTESSGARKLLGDEAIRIVSGYKNCETALSEFNNNPQIKLLDILFCEGGCINGPGISSPLTVDERRNKIVDYYLMNKNLST